MSVDLVCFVMIITLGVCVCVLLQIEAVTDAERNFDARIDGVTTLTYLSKVLVPNEEYQFRVAAINGVGNGEFSPFMMYRTNFSGELWILYNRLGYLCSYFITAFSINIIGETLSKAIIIIP